MSFGVIVDDEESILDEFVDSLELLGHTSRCFVNPLLALSFLSETKLTVDFVFVDLMMPQMDGMIFIKNAKKLTGLSTHFFLMTGVPEHTVSKQTEFPVSQVLRKPVSFTEISRLIT